MIGSGPAERTWKDCKRVLTKKRNRLDRERMRKIVFCRGVIRFRMHQAKGHKLEEYKEWEKWLLQQVEAMQVAASAAGAGGGARSSSSDSDSDSDGSHDGPSIFIDHIEAFHLPVPQPVGFLSGPFSHGPLPRPSGRG